MRLTLGPPRNCNVLHGFSDARVILESDKVRRCGGFETGEVVLLLDECRDEVGLCWHNILDKLSAAETRLEDDLKTGK